MLRKCLPNGRPLHVCIIGAGAAGLRASDILLQHGIKVTILEARTRAGGRIAQSKYLGPLVDLGPNWIHGTENNPIFDIAKQTDTVLHSWPEYQVCFDRNGAKVSDKDASDSIEAFWGIISKAFQYSNQNGASIPSSQSLMSFVKQQAQDKFIDEPKEAAEYKRRLIVQEAEIWGAFVGSSIEKQSLKFFWLEESLEGSNPFVAGTYTKILDTISQPALLGATIKYEHVVNHVRTNGNDKEGITVGTSDGKEEDFDEVIVTCPLGWLKQNQSVFEPALPSRLSQAIDSLGYGNLDKVYITFPMAFWDKAPTAAGAPIDIESQDVPNTTAKAAPLHQEDPTSLTPTHYAGFTHWYSPSYAPDTNPHAWPQQGLNLAALPSSTAHPTLLFYIFGETSTHIASLVTNAPTPKEAEKALLAFFAPYYSRLPNYTPNTPACTPSHALATAWAADEYAGYGSYSNFQTGSTAVDEDILTLRKGLPERGVWFAGEHTGPFETTGTVTGAYFAGEGVAARISALYGLE